FRVSLFSQEIDISIKRLCESPGVARLAIAGRIVRNTKQPAANVFFVSACCQMLLKTHERVLHNVLRFVPGESEAYDIFQKRLSLFLKQVRHLAGVPNKARKRQWEEYRVVAQECLRIPLYLVEQMRLRVFRVERKKMRILEVFDLLNR